MCKSQRTIPDIGLNFILAGKWDVIKENKLANIFGKYTWKKYDRDFSILSFERRTDIEAAEKYILGTKIDGIDLSWKMYDPINTLPGYACTSIISCAGGRGAEKSYASLIRNRDAPLYGESQFFSQPIRKIIYNTNDPGSKELSSVFYLDGIKKTNKDRIALNENGQPAEKESGKYFAEYVIQCFVPDPCDEKKEILREYRLDIHSIMLRLFSVGVMMLSIHTENVTSIKSYRKVNGNWVKAEIVEPIEKSFCNCGSFGRRMYQPFISWNDNHCNEAAFYSCIRFYESKKKESIQGGKQIPICYNLDVYPCKDTCKELDLLDPIIPYESELHKEFAHPNCLCFLEELFSGKCISHERWHELPEDVKERKRIVITPFHDDRMYVHGYFIDKAAEGVPNKLKTVYPLREEILKGPINYKDDRLRSLMEWYAILNLDRNCTASCRDLEMMRKEIDATTYSRWAGWGTLYGLTKTTFIMTLNDISDNDSYLVDNMQWHYFQLFLVTLLQRCSTMRFYEEAAAIMNQNVQIKDIPQLCDSLRSQYIIFLNSIWWKEISLQIQGQEMYRMLSENMEIDDNVKQLDEALSELHNYNEGVHQKKISGAMNLFSIAGMVWAIIELMGFLYGGMVKNSTEPSIVAAMLSALPCIMNFCQNNPVLGTLIGCGVILFIAYILSKWISKSIWKSKLLRKFKQLIHALFC